MGSAGGSRDTTALDHSYRTPYGHTLRALDWLPGSVANTVNPEDIRALTDEYGRSTPGRKVEFIVGSRWAYRAGSLENLVEVEVVRIGVKKPARLLVRWIADEFEGQQD
jgi:hypothetical protein